jgi:hypothetical protein
MCKGVSVGTIIDANQVLAPAIGVLAQEIDGELFVLPLALQADGGQAGVFALNATGRDFWNRLDGQKDLREIVDALSGQYGEPASRIEEDLQELVAELLRARVLVVVSNGAASQ